MMRVLIACIVLSLSAFPSLAASPKAEAAVKTYKALGADAGKLKIFCEMTKVMDATGDKRDAAAEAKIQGYMKQLGADFETAWSTNSDVDEDSSDARAIDTALDELTSKCT